MMSGLQDATAVVELATSLLGLIVAGVGVVEVVRRNRSSERGTGRKARGEDESPTEDEDQPAR
jgi:flagellar biosynthesis/type III secretory pathway M-ring protein FliF/YscJ